MSVSVSLADRIRERRKALRLTQHDLAERADVSFASIQSLERGSSNPRRNTLEVIAKALDMSVGDLLGETVETTAPRPSLSPSAVTGPLLASDAAVILAQLSSIGEAQRALLLALLFSDRSLFDGFSFDDLPDGSLEVIQKAK